MYRVLIVEDEILVRLGLRNSIDWGRYNMKVEADASNGQEAWDLFQDIQPEIVITDIKMPVMDGIELIRKIREINQSTRIVILSCVEEFEAARKAVAYGVSNYILKLTMTSDDIDTILTVLQQEINELEAKSTPTPSTLSLPNSVLIENLFKEYLFRQYHTSDQFQTELSLLGVQLHPDRLGMLIMEIDHYEYLQEKFIDKRGNLIQYSILNVLKEVLETYDRGVVIHDEQSRYMIVLNFQDVISEQRIHFIYQEITNHISKVMLTFFNVSITFGQSAIGSGFSVMRAQYRECLAALERKFIIGTAGIISIKDPVNKELVSNQLETLVEINDCILHDKFRMQLRNKVTQFIQQSDHYPKKTILHFFAQIMHLPLSHFPPEEGLNEAVLNYFNELEASETLYEAVTYYKQYVAFLKDKLQQNRIYSREVILALQFMKQHYRRNITMNEIAEHLEITPNYFSNMFKKETGEFITDYMNRLRVEEAKQILLSTGQRSYEIANQVGFSDQSYFSKVFRKYTGFSPKEYRSQWFRSKKEDGSHEADTSHD